MMKRVLLLAVIGALCLVASSCPSTAYHSCVKVDKPKKCIAVEVCEKPTKELCGKYYCEYPYTCASIKKSICKDFYTLKQKCEYKKVCKEVKIPCGKGACKITHDCVKENTCYIKKVHSDRKLMGYANAVATATNYGPGIAKSHAIAISTADEKKKPIEVYKPNKEVLVCEDKFSCVAKEPCKDIIIKKCIKEVKKPGIDVYEGGYDFHWYGNYHHSAKCGTEYCGYGYKCADVVIKKCIKPCGNYYCNYGEECVTYDKDCEDYAYLEKICKDVYEPTCVALTPYLKLHYKPPCKTVFKCEENPSVCGGKYCASGYSCAVDYKKSCDAYSKPKVVLVEKPVAIKHTTTKIISITGVAEYGGHSSGAGYGRGKHHAGYRTP